MEREFSAGGVVLRKMRGRWFVAVIKPRLQRPKTAGKATMRRSQAHAAVLALPKGNIDRDEKPAQTALREVEEETGLRAELITKLGDIRYVYLRNWGDQARVFKIVSFYLLRYRAGKLGNISPDMRIEVQRTFWMPLEKAPLKLSYKGEREVAEKARQYISAHPQLGASQA